MLAGELPYKADDALAMAIQHAQKPVPKLPPGLRHWQRFMERALAKSPARRFHDAAQMLSALEQVPASAHAGTWPGSPVVQRLRAVNDLEAGNGLDGDPEPRPLPPPA